MEIMNENNILSICLGTFIGIALGFILLTIDDNEVIDTKILNSICQEKFGEDYKWYDNLGKTVQIQCVKETIKEFKTVEYDIQNEINKEDLISCAEFNSKYDKLFRIKCELLGQGSMILVEHPNEQSHKLPSSSLHQSCEEEFGTDYWWLDQVGSEPYVKCIRH